VDNRLYNLQLFCANQDILIDHEIKVQGGAQYTLKKDGTSCHVTLYNRGTCYVRGVNSHLHMLLKAWCDNTFIDGFLHPDFAASWREWNTNADFLIEHHKKYGIPDESTISEDYRLNREITFHDYMFCSNRHRKISIKSLEFVVENWLNRFCFMNIPANQVVDIALKYIQDNAYNEGDKISFSLAAEAVSIAFVGFCSNKQFSCGGKCPFVNSNDSYDCLFELIDMMYMYSENPLVISYNRTNLNMILTGEKQKIRWISTDPSTPIEEKMRNALFEAGILNMPQYQAMAPERRYRVDFMIPTPNGGMLAIECDGLQYHANPTSYISDRRRDNLLLQHGITPVRFSSIDINEDIEGCIKTIEEMFNSYQLKKQVYHRNGRFGYFDSTN